MLVERQIVVPLWGLVYVCIKKKKKKGRHNLGSQNPGLIVIAKNVFGSNPPINPDVLTKAFQLDKNVVESLQKKFSI
jgi:hypothetical protein